MWGQVFCEPRLLQRPGRKGCGLIQGHCPGLKPFPLTNEIIGFSNVVIPNGDLQGLLGQVPMLNFITELLAVRRGESGLMPHGQECSEA